MWGLRKGAISPRKSRIAQLEPGPDPSEVTRILSAIQGGDLKAADDLLPVVYEELRCLAARKLSGEAPGQTLQATALVHEAYIRLVGSEDPGWENRGHFFAAAAEAMRRILVDRARRKMGLKHGGERERVDLDEAERLYKETLEIHKRVLGPEHPNRLTSMHNVATVLKRQGKLNEARKLNEETLEIRKRVLGREHPDTLMSMHNLANVLREQGELDEARRLQEVTLEIPKRILGPEHPDTLLSMMGVAVVLSGQGKLDEAERRQKGTLEMQKRVLGAEHPHTLMSMYNLAIVLRDQGEFDEARKHQQYSCP